MYKNLEEILLKILGNFEENTGEIVQIFLKSCRDLRKFSKEFSRNSTEMMKKLGKFQEHWFYTISEKFQKNHKEFFQECKRNQEIIKEIRNPVSEFILGRFQRNVAKLSKNF